VVTPQTRYAQGRDAVYLAYQDAGGGPMDVVYTAGWFSNVDLMWEQPEIAPFLNGISSFARLIVFDRRGTGLSDPIAGSATIDTMMEDVRTVMDAAGSERAVLIGLTMSSAMSSVFAATYPDRTAALILIQPTAKVARSLEFPLGESEAFHREETERIAEGWGTGEFERWFLSERPEALDDASIARLARYFRHGMSPGAAVAANQIWWETDFRHVLPAIHVPTLVVEPHDDPALGAYVAERISGSVLAHMPDEPAYPWAPGSTAVVDRIAAFVGAIRGTPAVLDRVLATVLFTDVVGSTERAADLGDAAWRELLSQHDRVLRTAIDRYRGRLVKTLGDGMLATFDGPARGVSAAREAAAAVREQLGIEIRAGCHTGEIELCGDDVSGMAVNIAARVADVAGPSEVLVSSTVKDLTAGSGLAFQDLGEHGLKGVPDPWRLYRATSG
jgi:class 3 adenylate cyclase